MVLELVVDAGEAVVTQAVGGVETTDGCRVACTERPATANIAQQVGQLFVSIAGHRPDGSAAPNDSTR